MGDLTEAGSQFARPLKSLVGAAWKMASLRDPLQALWTLICALCEDLELDRAGIFEYDRDRRVVTRLIGVDPNGKPEYAAPPIDVSSPSGPLGVVATGCMPYYLTDDAPRDYPELEFQPGVRALAVVPIITGGELLGLLGIDNCRSGRPIPETILRSLFLCAGLAAQSMFAIYQQKERQRVEALRRAIYSEVFQAATNGKIRLCGPGEIAEEWPTLEQGIQVEREQDVAVVRDLVRSVAESAGVTADRVWDLTLCASEAATNALRHGNGGAAAVDAQNGVVRIRIVDRGRGIPLEELPDATLRAGWSKGSVPSMGHGFSLMYQLADCLYLHTGPEGTVLILEMHVVPPDPTPAGWDGLL